MKTVAILQARLGSTRLPGKMLLPLLGKPLVQHVMERVARTTLVDDVVLAVPLKDAAEFAPLASGRAWLYAYAGDEADLVGRYLAAAEVQRADVIVRIPCDNPCVDPQYIDEAITQYLTYPYIFYSNASTVYLQDQRIDGLGCEVFSLSRLQWLDCVTTGQAEHREHLHRYFYEHEIDNWKSHSDVPLRLDVNTQADYEFISGIYTHFGHNRFTAQQIIAYLHQKEASHALEERVESESH